MQYDAVGRVVSVSYNDGSPARWYSYDSDNGWNGSLGYTKGRLQWESLAGYTTTQFTYDPKGNVTQTAQCLPDWCGNGSHDVVRGYSYDLAQRLTSITYNTHSQTVGLNYSYNIAGQLTSVTGGQNDAYGAPALWSVSGSMIGPFGPTGMYFGNNLTSGYGYDAVGRRNGSWLCSNGTYDQNCGNTSSQFASWASLLGSQVNWSCDTTRSTGCNNYSYDSQGRLSSSDSFGTHVADYHYDRWGNRIQQNQSGYSPQLPVDNGTNRISGFSYDAAGNLLNDGMHSYTYDPEGNVVSVDGGTTASYTYDALNHRVKEVVGGVTERISFDLNGRRSNSWHDGSTSMDSAQYYAGDTPVAFWTAIDGHIHFQHQDWLGTERARSGFTSVTDVRFASQAFGEGLSSSGPYNADWDPYHFAGQDHDTESDTEHATFRQYQPVQGRWMSPDPYDGSYDLSDPQSFNRYSYVSNNPLALTDPDGLQDHPTTSDSVTVYANSGDPLADVIAIALQYLVDGVIQGFEALLGIGHPSFAGNVTASSQGRRLLGPARGQDPHPNEGTHVGGNPSFTPIQFGIPNGSHSCIQSRANGKMLDYSQPLHKANGEYSTTQQHIQARHMPGVGRQNVSVYWTQDWSAVTKMNYWTFVLGDQHWDRGNPVFDFTFPNIRRWLTPGSGLQNGIGYDANGNDTLTNHLVLMPDCKTVVTALPIE